MQYFLLRKEYFGGIFYNINDQKRVLLSPIEYRAKLTELLSLKQQENVFVRIIEIDTLVNKPLPTQFLASPLNLYFEITKKCNSKCTHCAVNSQHKIDIQLELTLAEILALIQQFSQMGGAYIRFTGGEPTTHPKLPEMIRFAVTQGLIASMNTNGLVSRKKWELILAEGLQDIRISLDGEENTHNQIRGKNTYQNVIDSLKFINTYRASKKQNITIIINMVLSKLNYSELPHLFEIAIQYETKLNFILMRPTGRADFELLLSKLEVIDVAQQIQHLRNNYNMDHQRVIFSFDIYGQDKEIKQPYPFDNSRCSMATMGINIDALGRYLPCGNACELQDWIGGKITNNLLETWYDSPLLNKARNIIKNNCKGCIYYKKYCNGGCMINAYQLYNDINQSDYYCLKGIACN